MPKLSLFRSDKSNDYRFFDRTIAEMLNVGATDLYVHKYLGVQDNGTTDSLSTPERTSLDPTNIQDLLFLENRDRTYDSSVYRIRGHYNVANLDFDLSQFGLFLNNDVIFIVVHYNTMIDTIGRKLMVGDVFELPHLTDYHPLNETIPVGLRRYYQITDANFASEGFSQTWFPHLWRIKCEPLVDSQEFSNILKTPTSTDNYLGNWNSATSYTPGYVVSYGNQNYVPVTPLPNGLSSIPAGTPCTDTTYWQLDTADNIADILGRYNTNLAINDALIAEADRLVPKTGYDRHQLYLVSTDATTKQPQLPKGVVTGLTNPLLGSVQMVQSPGYSPSPGIVIAAGALKNWMDMPINNNELLQAFMNMTLEIEEVEPDKLPSGGGQVTGELVIAAKAGAVITDPYGTTDNTYSVASDFPSSVVTADTTVVGSTTITVLEIPKDAWPGIILSATVTLLDGQTAQVFDTNTVVIDRDLTTNTITINKPTLFAMPANTLITIASNFTKTVTPKMDFRADADPRFNYIKNYTPLGFGYSGGYMTGDGTAPNGLPFESGTTFPSNPKLGDYFLRTDYLPQTMYRWDGSLWQLISSNTRAAAGMNSNQTLLGSFINNTATTTLTNGNVIPQVQALSTLFKATPD
jgi:hypothetical protein